MLGFKTLKPIWFEISSLELASDLAKSYSKELNYRFVGEKKP